MKYLSAFAGATLVNAIAIVSANAADMYRAPEGVSYKDAPVPYVSWAGFYAGVNGGYGWNADEHDISLTNPPVTATTKGLQAEGGFGGGQIGYNWQGIWHPHLVLGIEADIQGSGISDGFNRTIDTGRDVLNAHTSLDYFGTVRGRVGYAFENILVYGTGGLAYGGVNTHLHVSNPGSLAFADGSKDETETGYAAGGGVEYAITPAWSLKVEYQYINLGSDKFIIPITGASGTVTSNNIDNTYNTVRAGINYHIGSVYEPLK